MLQRYHIVSMQANFYANYLLADWLLPTACKLGVRIRLRIGKIYGCFLLAVSASIPPIVHGGVLGYPKGKYWLQLFQNPPNGKNCSRVERVAGEVYATPTP